MIKIVAPEVAWPHLYSQARAAVPEAFDSGGHVLNLIEGEWGHPGHGKHYFSAVDGTTLGTMPMIGLETARRAVRFAAAEQEAWSRLDLDERRQRVRRCLDGLQTHRDLIARLLIWEIGKPYAQACIDVDRCVSGVEWYLAECEGMLAGRQPVGLISNIASWNYPYSVLVHSMLVQMLAGNSTIAKTPTDGGIYALTVGLAIARRAGLPVSLVSGSGGQLSDALVRNHDVDCLAFVGGKTNGRDIASSLYDREKRYMLEMEGVNCYGIWKASDWTSLAAQLKKGFDYGKQRCTAYVRYVVQRELFPKFVEMYLPALQALRFGNPTLVAAAGDPLPVLDFGPMINSKKAEELNVMHSEAIGNGAIGLYEGGFEEGMFLANQDISAYSAPRAVLNVPRNCRLHHNEPFGPLDSIVIVDRIEELVAEMNISNGNLVSSIACDDLPLARQIAGELRAFKVGINQTRSRGDREETFGGIGQSWKGAFVGGRLLVQSVTTSESHERLCGNFPDYTLLPESL